MDAPKDNELSNLKSASVLDDNRETQLSNEQVLRDVKKLMESLPENQRDVVYMRFFQELSFKEIAEQTNVSINTSLGRMRYAIINLRKLTREHGISLNLEWSQVVDNLFGVGGIEDITATDKDIDTCCY